MKKGGNFPMKKLKAKLMPYLLSIMIATSTLVVIPPTTAVDVQAKAKTSYVYIASSGNGKCYHKNKKCSRMKKTKKLTKAQAKKKGYRACKKCYR